MDNKIIVCIVLAAVIFIESIALIYDDQKPLGIMAIIMSILLITIISFAPNILKNNEIGYKKRQLIYNVLLIITIILFVIITGFVAIKVIMPIIVTKTDETTTPPENIPERIPERIPFVPHHRPDQEADYDYDQPFDRPYQRENIPHAQQNVAGENLKLENMDKDKPLSIKDENKQEKVEHKRESNLDEIKQEEEPDIDDYADMPPLQSVPESNVEEIEQVDEPIIDNYADIPPLESPTPPPPEEIKQAELEKQQAQQQKQQAEAQKEQNILTIGNLVIVKTPQKQPVEPQIGQNESTSDKVLFKDICNDFIRHLAHIKKKTEIWNILFSDISRLQNINEDTDHKYRNIFTEFCQQMTLYYADINIPIDNIMDQTNYDNIDTIVSFYLKIHVLYAVNDIETFEQFVMSIVLCNWKFKWTNKDNSLSEALFFNIVKSNSANKETIISMLDTFGKDKFGKENKKFEKTIYNYLVELFYRLNRDKQRERVPISPEPAVISKKILIDPQAPTKWNIILKQYTETLNLNPKHRSNTVLYLTKQYLRYFFVQILSGNDVINAITVPFNFNLQQSPEKSLSDAENEESGGVPGAGDVQSSGSSIQPLFHGIDEEKQQVNIKYEDEKKQEENIQNVENIKTISSLVIIETNSITLFDVSQLFLIHFEFMQREPTALMNTHLNEFFEIFFVIIIKQKYNDLNEQPIRENITRIGNFYKKIHENKEGKGFNMQTLEYFLFSIVLANLSMKFSFTDRNETYIYIFFNLVNTKSIQDIAKIIKEEGESDPLTQVQNEKQNTEHNLIWNRLMRLLWSLVPGSKENEIEILKTNMIPAGWIKLLTDYFQTKQEEDQKQLLATFLQYFFVKITPTSSDIINGTNVYQIKHEVIILEPPNIPAQPPQNVPIKPKLTAYVG